MAEASLDEPIPSGGSELFRASDLFSGTSPALSPANYQDGDGNEENHRSDDLGLCQAHCHLEIGVVPSGEEYQETSYRVSCQED